MKTAPKHTGLLHDVSPPMFARVADRAAFLRRVWRYFYPERFGLLTLVSATGGSTLVGLAQVWPLAILVDVVLTRGAEEDLARRLFGPLSHSELGQIVLLAVAALVLRLVQELLSMARSLMQVRISHQATMRVRCDLFRKLQALNVSFHRSQPQGDTLYRLMQDAPGCEQMMNVGIEVAVATFTLVVMLAVMASRSIELSLLGLAAVPLLILVNVVFGRHLGAESSAARSAESQLASVAQRNVSTMVLVQAFRREGSEFDTFQLAAGSSARAWWRVQWRMAVYRLCVGVIFGSGAAAIFGYGGYCVSRGSMTVGDLMVFLTYLAMFYDPLCKISGAGANMQRGVVGMQRVFEVLDREVQVADRPGAIALPRQPRTLSLHDVSFSYGDRRGVLNRLNVTIRPGQSVAFLGSSGVGKSTLLNLLPRFFDPTSGHVALDGIDLRDVKLEDLRRHVALVLQDSPLVPATIRENIAYGRPDATDEEIRQAARMAGADDFIQQLQAGYETLVAEAGQNLSGGQRQRLGIARALLTEAPLMVLDEPTSALDTTHERQFVRTLRSLHGQRTIVIVSHRLSTVQHCDQIFVMDQGRIVERGTHEELLALGGRYWHMAAQSQEPEALPAAASAA